MNNLPFYIISSDATSHILPATAYLLNKYWGNNQEFKILGNNKSKYDLPNNFEFIKIKNENDIQNWSYHIYNFLKENEKSEHVIITLDDYFPISLLDINIYNDLLKTTQDNEKVGRVNIGYFNSNRINEVNIISHKDDYDLFFLNQNATYRLTCQTSIWKTEYLLNFLKNNFTPWDLELKGSLMSNNDGFEIVGTFKKHAFDWIQESVLSNRHPGKINVLGLPIEDLKHLLNNGILNRDLIQFGMWTDRPVIDFKEIGFDFNLEFIRNKIDDYTFKELVTHYNYVYNNI